MSGIDRAAWRSIIDKDPEQPWHSNAVLDLLDECDQLERKVAETWAAMERAVENGRRYSQRADHFQERAERAESESVGDVGPRDTPRGLGGP